MLANKNLESAGSSAQTATQIGQRESGGRYAHAGATGQPTASNMITPGLQSPEPDVTFEELQALEEELERLKRTE